MKFDRKTRYLTQLGAFKAPIGWDKDERPVVMFHGVSVGEVIALEKLIKATRAAFHSVRIVVTTGTNTGQEIAHKKLADSVDLITYFPADAPLIVENFLSKVNPDIVFIAETEIWPYFASVCKRRGITLYTINGRISDSSFKFYKPFKFFFNWVLNNYTGIFTQSEDDNSKFQYLGAQNAEVMGNLKFDITPPVVDIQLNTANSRVLLAGSTHSGEDEIVFDVYSKLKAKHPDLKLLHASRHLTRLDDIKLLLDKRGFKYGYRSNNDSFEDYDIILLDTLGELAKMYSYADIAFIGGSFNTTGGHNPLEASIWNKPVVSGPDTHNFKDIYKLLTSFEAGFVVKTPVEFESVLDRLLSDKAFYDATSSACRKVFEAQSGALDFVLDKIRKFYNT